MSIATALILACEPQRRFQNGFNASAPFPLPTKTTAPVSRSRTNVRYLWPLPTEISSMAIRTKCFILGLPNRLARSRLPMSLIRSHPTFRCLATSWIVMRRDSSNDTDQEFSATFDQEDGATRGSRGRSGGLGAYANTARHAAFFARSRWGTRMWRGGISPVSSGARTRPVKSADVGWATAESPAIGCGADHDGMTRVRSRSS